MPFLILTQARSGSYHLAALLNSAPDITCFGEIFKENALELPKPQLAKLGLTNRDMAARDADPIGLLNRLRKDTEAEGAIFGFKDFLPNLNRVKLFGKLGHSKNWQKIILLRNPIERYISRRRASETGVFVVKHGDAVTPDLLHAKIRFDADSFGQFLNNHMRFVEVAQSLHQKHGDAAVFTALYEKLSDPQHLHDILKFVGSKASADQLTSDHVKQYEKPLSEGVENWDDLLTYLRENDLTRWLPSA
ncbi:hypothetical protein [Cypionkella sp. TWP1-2-1b2]|uniref:hypothetical protein n=1 Tax=Cypionkella sp. TWP1-2-1b2 TaxID=2804675 RepID=UPI003CF5E606